MWHFKTRQTESISFTQLCLFGGSRMRFGCSVLLAFMLTTPIALAQDSNDDETELEEVVVTATRIPTPLADTLSSTAIITAEDIERLKPRDFGDLLGRMSGIGFRDSGGRGSSGGLFIRGNNGDHVLFLINGVRIGSATLGSTPIENIPIESIERIEIIKGPMSGVYGSDAIGGVIQIFTKEYKEERTFGGVKSTFGTNNFQKYDAQAGYGNDGYSVYASLSQESTDGIDRTEFKGGGNEDIDSFKQTSGSFSITANLQDNLVWEIDHVQSAATTEHDNTSISTVAIIPIMVGPKDNKRLETEDEHNNRLQDYEDKCPAVKYQELAAKEETKAPNPSSHRVCKGKGWYGQSKQNTTSARIEYEHSDQLSVSGLLGSSTDSSRDINIDTNRNDLFRTKKFDYSIQADLILSNKSQISFGVDYQKDKVFSTSADYTNNERSNKGYFALWQFQGAQSSSVINLRNDRNSAFGSISNYSLQQSFDFSEQYKIIASYGSAFKAPSFNDLYYPYGLGNPDLKPEESKSYELSIRANLDQTNWQINVFRTKVTNLIAWAPISPGSFTWKPNNVDKATLKGVEVELSREWDDYRSNVNLDYLDAQDDKTGKFLTDRARASASIELGKQVNNLYVGVNGFAEHSRFDGSKTLPGYTLWGLTAQYDLSDTLSISGRIDNLFDKEYVTNTATSDNNYQNEGRTIELSLEYRF